VGRHIVYLSKYLPVSDALYQMTPEQVFEYSLPYIQRMFPRIRSFLGYPSPCVARALCAGRSSRSTTRD
jgi:hypothetical protein